LDEKIGPLYGAAPPEIPLAKTPLVSVVSQVRLTEILSITQQSFIAPFQEAIRRDYPNLSRVENPTVSIGPAGASDVKIDVNWRFASSDENWRVTLATNFISFEAKAYTSRTEFVDRWSRIFDAVGQHIQPSAATRIGTRYVNRVVAEPFERLKSLVRSELLGPSELRSNMEYCISEARCRTAEGKLGARWGWLPKNATHDPNVMPPEKTESWLLDIDVYFERSRKELIPFVPAELAKMVQDQATRAYAFFRWAVTEEFLRTYGGD
jgi:uncharacterized protein (TIGR04255 family)